MKTQFKFKVGNKVASSTGVTGTIVHRFRASANPKAVALGVDSGTPMYVIFSDRVLTCPEISPAFHQFVRAECALAKI